MRRSTPISRASWISAVMAAVVCGAASGCQNRAPSLRMLDVRAGYDSRVEDEEVALYQRGRFADGSLARRSTPRVARVWVFPHELPTRDYFWGGYVSLVVSDESWVLDPEKEDPPAALKERSQR